MTRDSVAFDRAADYYDETRGFPPGHEAAVARLFVQAGGLTSRSRVLEIGVGTGRIALPLARHVASITGVDLARPMMARLRAKQRGEPVRLVQGDVTELPLPARAFDAVLAVHVFHLVAGWEQALAEVARVLRPGAVLLSGWNDNDRRDEARDILWETWQAATGADSVPNVGVGRAQYRTFLTDAGWQRAGDMLTHPYTVTRTAEDFLRQLERRIWSNTWRLSVEALARGAGAVREAIREHRIDPTAPQTYARTFNVEAYRPPA